MRPRRLAIVATATIALAAPSAAIAATLTGTDGADRLVGTTANDTISGYAGNDDIVGGGGRDTIRGNQGFDFITATTNYFAESATQATVVEAGIGHDVIASREGMSVGTKIDCGGGEDIVFSDQMGLAASPTTTGCEFVITWQFGTKSWGTSGYRDATPRPDSKLMRGTNDIDRLMGTSAPENMIGGDGNDMLFGNIKVDSPAPDLLAGGPGDDLIDTGDNRGNATSCPSDYEGDCGMQDYEMDDRHDVVYVVAGSGNDIVIARAGSMVVDCGPGYDIVYRAGSLNDMHPHGCEEVNSMA